MKLTSNGETLAESKVLILYILKNVSKAINNNTLYRIILSVLDMNYFYYQQFLLDLINSGFILNYEQQDQSMYLITEKGIKTLELTEDILPGILKLQVDTNLKYALEDANEENSIVAEYTPINENYYNVTCKIMENNECLFEVKTFAGSREQAKQIVENWKKHAGTIYPKLLETLTENLGDDSNDSDDEIVSDMKEINLGSPRDVYNYDVINRTTYEENEIESENVSEKSSQISNSSDIIEGNMSLFDMLDKKNK